MDRAHLAERARDCAAALAAQGVHAVALTWVDNAGITRVKSVPTGRLPEAAAWGAGMSSVFDVFCLDDSVTTSRHIGGPTGDLRLHPDLDRLTVLAAQPGWAWAPVDRWTQEGEPHTACQRRFARTMMEWAAAAGLTLRMAFEVEWFLGADAEEPRPAGTGPAYGMNRLVALSDYGDDLLAALAAQGVAVEQYHPEYSPGQLELSVAATDPVAAADANVLVRQTIRAVSARHGLRVSFAPVVIAGQVGNGGHLHFSVRDADGALFAGGAGPYAMTGRGESVLAGVLARLPALCAIGAPGVASYLRLVPQRWAGPYQCWGRENREAGLRFVTGVAGQGDQAANAELKCVDGAANPYLVVGAVCAIVLDSAGAGLRLPAEIAVDPAALPEGDQPPRLPVSLPEAIGRLEADDGLRAAMGEALFDAFLAVRRAEVDLFADAGPAHVAAATRWRY
ncbi:glutamine synthetase family protein [Dactylosporangium sp. NPDC000555]|uniref:glutamine synthetase family protein n=1 Tax=Dactylosporangium sp. NPDC000555 TaxID=3154260 RepID=UPI00331DB676